ncbi:ABC-type multidrug transport system ATPase subunit [Microbacterium testaceum]|nr:ABC-type multidrug transport system ATPase subunit [Microbacterium testaceum]
MTDSSSAVPPPSALPDGVAPPTPTDSLPAMDITGLVKRFGEKVAVAGLDLRVPAGSFYGLVGPNGAGKTTTLSMATGLLRPDDPERFTSTASTCGRSRSKPRS